MAELDQGNYYKHSGRTGLSIPLILLLGFPAAAVLAIVYAYVVVFCPIVGYVNVIFLGVYVFLAGFAVGTLAKWGKCRSQGLLFGLGCLAGLIGLYFSWVFSFKALGAEFEVVTLLIRPHVLWAMIVEFNKEGWWGPSGIFQWILCVVEAIVFILGTGLIALAVISREVFCEKCGSWCEQDSEKRLKFTEEFSASFEGIEEGKLNHLDVLKLPDADISDYPRFDAEILKCTGCCQTSAIRFKLTTLKKDKDGSVEPTSDDVDGILLVVGSD